MLQQVSQQNLLAVGEPQVDRGSSELAQLDSLLAAARRQLPIALTCIALGVVLAAVYVATAQKLYTASTLILVDPKQSQIASQATALAGVLPDDASVLSQAELLKSPALVRSVVEDLGLHQNEEFMNTGGSLLGTVVGSLASLANVGGWLGGDATAATLDATTRAAEQLAGSLAVTRVGRTYVIQLSYTSPSRAFAADIANAVAGRYLDDLLQAKFDATRRAGTWLEDRLEELRTKSLDSDLAVQRFRREHGLVATGGQLVSEQQVSEISSQIVVAQAETAEARARYERIRAIIDGQQTDAVVNEALENSVISTLRAQYLEASARYTEIAQRSGSSHVQAQRLQSEMQELERLMFAELGRIAESYRSDLQVAEAREQSLRASMEEATGVNAEANETLVGLREMEQEAETYRSLYQNYLQRYQETVQQESFPITETRIVSSATQPTASSHPKKLLSLAMGLLLGAMAGGGLGVLREFRDRSLRTRDQVRDALGLDVIGTLPRLPSSKGIETYVATHPFSQFAEILRGIKIAVDGALDDMPSKVIGIVSVLQDEGKSTVAANFAQLLGRQGAKTLLIDADLSRRGLTRAMGRDDEPGLMDVVLGDKLLPAAIRIEPKTRLAFMPAGIGHERHVTSDVLSSTTMATLISDAGKIFDYIVVDLPPIGAAVDARAFSPRVDGFVLVVEWGETPRHRIESVLEAEQPVYAKCVGVVLNKADMRKINLYQMYGGGEYAAVRSASEHVVGSRAKRAV